MARQCDLCMRSPKAANSRSKSNIATKRRLMTNLQKQKIDGERLTVCTSCLKTHKKKQKATA